MILQKSLIAAGAAVIILTAVAAPAYAGPSAFSTPVSVPAQASGAISAFATADAQAQLAAPSQAANRAAASEYLASAAGSQGTGSAGYSGNPAQTSSGAADSNKIIGSDASTAEYSELNDGFSWDSGTATVLDTSVASETSTSLTVNADISETFHITGTPNDGSLMHESILDNPYAFTFTLGSDGSWHLASALQEDPNDLNTDPQGQTAAPTAEQAADTLAATQPLKTSTPITIDSTPSASTISYDGSAAVAYAARWNGAQYGLSSQQGWNPAYAAYDDDCQNFTSQAVHAGGIPFDQFGSWVPGAGL